MKYKCLKCGKPFEAHPSNKRKYCSRECWEKVHSEVMKGNKLSEKAKRLIGLKNSINLKGRILLGQFKKGCIPWQKGKTFKEDKRIIAREKSPYWKGGVRKDRGYITILTPKHPYSNSGYIFEHRLVVEQQIGRLLTKKEIVHHIGNTDDNRPKMLIAFISNSAHQRFHSNPNKVKLTEIIFDGRKLGRRDQYHESQRESAGAGED